MVVFQPGAEARPPASLRLQTHLFNDSSMFSVSPASHRERGRGRERLLPCRKVPKDMKNSSEWLTRVQTPVLERLPKGTNTRISKVPKGTVNSRVEEGREEEY